MYSRLMNHVVTNTILAPEQYGFWPSFSTELALFNFTKTILDEFKKKTYCRRHFS
jgi:hypothetical protein